jgi:peptide/nickel transport system ATP-binding protein
MSLLDITNLSLSINGTPILRDVSLSVNTGEIVAVTGESGSGKSLTVLATMGLLPTRSQTTGTITFKGQDLLITSEADLCNIRGNNIGMVFQEPMTALNPVQTIPKNNSRCRAIRTNYRAGNANALSLQWQSPCAPNC